MAIRDIVIAKGVKQSPGQREEIALQKKLAMTLKDNVITNGVK